MKGTVAAALSAACLLCFLPTALCSPSTADELRVVLSLAAGLGSWGAGNGRRRELPAETVFEEDAYRTTPELIRSCGYPAEEHVVETEDGYLLEVHRIPSPEQGVPVLLVHGLICSSAVWVDNTANGSLAFLLSDAGYDVWLANVRGNTYGKKHRTLDPKMKKFWDFSLDEQSLLDVSATIDHVLRTTGFASLLYLGHSLGTANIFALLARRPDYHDKVKGIVAMAPISVIGNIRSLARTFVRFADTLKFGMEFLGYYEMMSSEMFARGLANGICQEPRKKSETTRTFVLSPLCKNTMDKMLGKEKQLNESRIPVYLHHAPAGTSVRMLHHMAQLVRSGRFASYDYQSKAKNEEKYQSVSPPEYDVTKVQVPVCLMWSEADYLSDPRDVEWLANRLPNVHLNYRVPYKRFTHPDFLWAKNARSVLYDQVLASLDNLWKLDKTSSAPPPSDDV